MQRIKHPTAAETKPPLNSTGTVGFYEEGEPGGQLSTYVTADWLNGVQEEIATVIEDGGNLTLDITDNTQLLASIRDMIDTAVASASGTPVGAIIMYGGTAAPNDNWGICDGGELSRSGYPELFDVVGTSFGSGNGTTTFNKPDFRDRVARGHTSTRAIGNFQAGQTAIPALAFTTDASGSVSTTLTSSTLAAQAHAGGSAASAGAVSQQTITSGAGSAHTHTVNGNNITGYETANHTHGLTIDAATGHVHNIRWREVGCSSGSTNVIDYIEFGNGPSQGSSENDGGHGHTYTMGGVSSNHAHVVVPDAESAHTHSVVVPAISPHTHSVSVNDHPAHSHTVPLSLSAHSHTGTIAANGVSETRMPNVAVNFLIKIKPGADYDGGTP